MEFIVEKIGMSRTVEVPSVPVTLLKVVDAKVCEVREDGKALVAYNSSKKLNKSIEGQQTKYGISKEFNKFMTIEVAEGTEAGDLSAAALAEATVVKTSLDTKGRGFQGGMKRHGFSGGPAEHGHTDLAVDLLSMDTDSVEESVQSVTQSGQDVFKKVRKCLDNMVTLK